MTKKNNKKGFTLIEIMSVIVLVAILFIIFTPLIVGIIKKSQLKSFKTEILNLVQDVEKTYTSKSASSNKDIIRVTVNDKSYFYLCMTLEDLVNQGYSNKKLDNGYGGYIQSWVAENNEVINFVNVTNGRYYLQGNLDIITNSKFLPSAESSKDIEAASSSIKCPSNYNIPSKNVFNLQSEKITEELEEYIKNN